jgi:hypothetical protein
MRNNLELIVSGFIAAITLFWILKDPKAVNAITGAGVGAVTGSFTQLIGGGHPNA